MYTPLLNFKLFLYDKLCFWISYRTFIYRTSTYILLSILDLRLTLKATWRMLHGASEPVIFRFAPLIIIFSKKTLRIYLNNLTYYLNKMVVLLRDAAF
jgi:hypothetical protein